MNISIKDKIPVKTLIWLLASLIFVLCLHGAVPFFALPTLAQVVWSTGFSQSFINDSLFTIYAKNIGAPVPAAIAFGLAGAWPTAVLMKLGFHPSDAYSAMAAFWLTAAFISAYKIGRFFGVKQLFAITGAILWLSMPVIWNHSAASMVSFGIALLSFYFFAALHLFLQKNDLPYQKFKYSLLYVFACIVAVFMDGYSFMMFAVGASILALWVFVIASEQRRQFLFHAFPTHVLGFGLAYLLYALYIGKTQFEPSSIDFFRGWGVDLTFLLVPSQGMLWIPDFLGWSVSRSGKEFFGDSSVWMTTFSLPLIAAASWAWWKIRKQRQLSSGVLLMAVFGFYMSLGPSLKVNSVKPVGETVGSMMPAEYAVAPTGSALLSESLPGFKNMRASYRWAALGIFGSWLLVVLLLSSRRCRVSNVAVAFIGLITLLNLPHPLEKWAQYVNNREMFHQIDSDLLKMMKEDFHHNEQAAFLPYRNDFLVNYLASRLDIKSYNIGGDKNLDEARRHWPETLRQANKVDDRFLERVLLLLALNESDVVVLPYIDMLWAAHSWPYPIQFREELKPIVSELKDFRFVEVVERKYYAIAKLNREAVFTALNNVLETWCPPSMCLKRQTFTEGTPSQVGIIKNGQLISEGKQGVLLFGPYRPLNPGVYRLVVRGEGTVTDTAWVDVVSQKGEVPHARFPLSSTDDVNTGVLVDGRVTLESPAKDVEVRVFVGTQDVVRLNGYELVMENLDDITYLLKTWCLPPMCLNQRTFTEKTPSQVGIIKNGQLISEGKQGVLLFGPYRPLNPGVYRLVVRGEGTVTDTAWVDVVSQKGEVPHARFPLSSTDDVNTGVLVDGRVTLESPAKDVEVRVFVGTQDVVRLNGYELVMENLDEMRNFNN